MYKRYIAGVLCLLCMSVNSAFAGPYLGENEVAVSDTTDGAVYFMVKNRIMSVDENDAFSPYRHMNRAEFVKAAMSALRGNSIPYASNCFPDVGKEWYAPYICTLSEKKIVHGDVDGLFHPERAITLYEAATVIFGIILEYPDSRSLEFLAAKRVIPTTFWSPEQSIKRIDAAYLLGALIDERFLPDEYQNYGNLDGIMHRHYSFERAVNEHDLGALEQTLAANVAIGTTVSFGKINEGRLCCTVTNSMSQQASDFLKFIGNETFTFDIGNATSLGIYSAIQSARAVNMKNPFFFPETPYEYIAGVGSKGGLLFYARNDLKNKKIMRVLYISGVRFR